jgi:hypothetical protein
LLLLFFSPSVQKKMSIGPLLPVRFLALLAHFVILVAAVSDRVSCLHSIPFSAFLLAIRFSASPVGWSS